MDAIYLAGMLPARKRPMPLKAERGLLGQPRCTGCGVPCHPAISDAAASPIERDGRDDFMDGFRAPYCTRCRLQMRMRCDLAAAGVGIDGSGDGH
jgi:hypothetical protein